MSYVAGKVLVLFTFETELLLAEVGREGNDFGPGSRRQSVVQASLSQGSSDSSMCLFGIRSSDETVHSTNRWVYHKTSDGVSPQRACRTGDSLFAVSAEYAMGEMERGLTM